MPLDVVMPVMLIVVIARSRIANALLEHRELVGFSGD
jgi:hypothetical protein